MYTQRHIQTHTIVHTYMDLQCLNEFDIFLHTHTHTHTRVRAHAQWLYLFDIFLQYHFLSILVLFHLIPGPECGGIF